MTRLDLSRQDDDGASSVVRSEGQPEVHVPKKRGRPPNKLKEQMREQAAAAAAAAAVASSSAAAAPHNSTTTTIHPSGMNEMRGGSAAKRAFVGHDFRGHHQHHHHRGPKPGEYVGEWVSIH